jgi:hypothetical protein
MVMVVSAQIGRQKELQQIRDELQELRQELGNRGKGAPLN